MFLLLPLPLLSAFFPDDRITQHSPSACLFLHLEEYGVLRHAFGIGLHSARGV